MECAKCKKALAGRAVWVAPGCEDRWCMDCAPLAAAPTEICIEPPKLVTVAEHKEKSVREILQHMLDRADEFTGVVVAANCKNGEQYLRSSKIDLREKSYLLAFFQSWVLGIFKIHYDDGETSLDGK